MEWWLLATLAAAGGPPYLATPDVGLGRGDGVLLQRREAVRRRLPAPVRVLDRDVPLDLVRVRVRERLPRLFVLAAKIALLLYRDRVLRRVGPAYRDGDVPAGVRAVAAAVLAVGTARELSQEQRSDERRKTA